MPAYYLEALTVFLGLALLMVESFGPTHDKKLIGTIAAFGLAFLFILNLFAIGPEKAAESASWASWPLWEFYRFDASARFYKGFSLLCAILVVLMTMDYRSVLSRYTDHPKSEAGTGEYYTLTVFACAGLMWVSSAVNLISAFVGVELVSLSFLALTGYMRRNVGALEAAAKYLIISALSAGFFVYGIAWIYGTTGTFDFALMGERIAALENTRGVLFGISMVLIAIAFKISAVPMHVWVPDVYQGAPTPTTAFFSVGSKAAGFILLLRFLDPLLQADSPVAGKILFILALMAGATLLFGNLAAMAQSNFKRLLAYSAIAHAGYLILAIAAWSPTSSTDPGSVHTVGFYLAAYLIMTLAAFFALAQVNVQRNSDEISAFNGLGKSSPLLAIALTIIMAALAGVPLTVGFIGKFFVFSVAVHQGLWLLVGIAFIAAAAGFYYYFKLIRAMWWTNSDSPESAALPLPPFTRSAIAVATIAILVFGVYPQPLLWILG